MKMEVKNHGTWAVSAKYKNTEILPWNLQEDCSLAGLCQRPTVAPTSTWQTFNNCALFLAPKIGGDLLWQCQKTHTLKKNRQEEKSRREHCQENPWRLALQVVGGTRVKESQKENKKILISLQTSPRLLFSVPPQPITTFNNHQGDISKPEIKITSFFSLKFSTNSP